MFTWNPRHWPVPVIPEGLQKGKFCILKTAVKAPRDCSALALEVQQLV